MNFGIITYIAEDGSHGFLYKLDNLEEKHVFNIIKRGYRDDSLKFHLKGNLELQKFQIVTFREEGKNVKTGKTFIKIGLTDFRAIVRKEDKTFNIIIVEPENEIYGLEAKENQFPDSEIGVTRFQIHANIGRLSSEFRFEKIDAQEIGKENFGFWIDKFIKLSSKYTEEFADLFDYILESIITFLESRFKEKFDLNKLLTKAIIKIKEGSSEDEFNALTYFISRWQENYPDLFRYSQISEVLNPNTSLKTELWVLDLYSFEELFEENYSITNDLIEYAKTQDEAWNQRFLLKLKSINVPSEHIQKVLFNSIPKIFSENFETIRSWIEFVSVNFPEIKAQYLEEIKKNITSEQEIQLWENELIELPSIKIIKEAFNSVSNKTKNKLIHAVPLSYKFLLINSALNKGLDVQSYYSVIFDILKTFILKSKIYVFDIEYDGHRIKEIAFLKNNKIVNATSQDEVEILLPQFSEQLRDKESYIAGHNIERFDIPLLRERIELPDDIHVIDTLSLETLLAPALKSFALDTKHNAKDDVEHTINLLTNQVIRLLHLSKTQFKKIERFIDQDFLKLITPLRDGISVIDTDLNRHIEEESIKYFIAKDTGRNKTLEFNKFLDEQANKPTFIIAPKEFYPLLAELSNIQFFGDTSDYSKYISEEKIKDLLDDSLEKYLLESFVDKCKEENKVPIYANLPSRIKIIISENATIDFITEQSRIDTKSENHICISPEKIFEALPFIKESNRTIILLESSLISVSEKTLLKTLDYAIFQQRLNTDTFWIYFTGGQSRVEITREDLLKLNIDNIPDHFDFFWIEKTSFDTFHVWGNYDVKELLKSKLKGSSVYEFSFSRDELENENCKYVIPKSKSGNLTITRFNPETRYRDRYWTFQINLVKNIISLSNKPTVLIINQQKEKQKLYDYFTSIHYYVPDLRASIIRQVNLLISHPSSLKVLIITKEQIPEIIQSEDLEGSNFIIDSFELEEKWFIAKGTGYLLQADKTESGLKFRNDYSQESSDNDDDDDPDQDKDANSMSSSRDVFLLLKIQKPIIDYYRWLFHSADKNAVIWLTDSRLADFSGLEEEWKAKKKFIFVWNNEDEYEKDYESVKVFFPSPKHKEEIKLDINATKETLREIFLKGEDGKINKWYKEQDDFLNEILPAEKDILVTLPTGGGKSILFQGPALYRGCLTSRLTIVVTPLKALMEDQVNKLWELNFWGSVEYLNRDRKDIQYLYRKIAGGEILLLYITPERFRSKSFINALKMRLENDGGLEYAVYDEAHCVSQWGLDFRPDYLNSTMVNIALKEKSDSKFPLLLFSATVTEQVYDDFQIRFNNSINRLENYTRAYNPIREHIAINFESSKDSKEKLNEVAKAILNGNFNHKKSRCIVFVPRRKDAEENVHELERILNEVDGSNSYTGRVAYFHAGMNLEERQEVYNAYKSGDIFILLATKAFGMGMDIPNIHYVYHYGPSGTLEDYLQEVGRAGRNARQLKDAGFSIENPIQSKCFYEKKDFGRIKDLLQKGRLTWSNLILVFNSIINYYDKFRDFETQSDKPIVIPSNFLSQTTGFENIRDKDQLLRLSLYWLEKLERIKLGFYAPAQLVFSEYTKPPDSIIENEAQRKLILEIEKAWNQKLTGADSISIELNTLLSVTELPNSSELLKLIYKCQKKEIFIYVNDVIIYPTKKKMDELKYNNEHWWEAYYPAIAAVYDLSFTLMDLTPEKKQRQFEGDIIEEQKRIVAGECFNENTLPWCKKIDATGNIFIDEKRIQKEQLDFERNKVKFSFTLTDYIPKVRYQSLITHKIGQKPKIVQVIYNGCKEKDDWKKFLKEFKENLISLLRHVTNNYILQGEKGKRYNVSKLVIDLGLENKETEYIENLITFAKWLGYLHYEGSFVPMGTELYMLSKNNVRSDETNSLDKLIYDDFETSQKLRELRLIALECLSEFDNKGNYNTEQLKKLKNEFITDYFSCKNAGDIISLLELYLGQDHSSLKGFRDEALKEKYDELSDEQKKVYDEDATKNMQVIAGPGSGKTHTLILRVARMIHQENVNPENILVLAYNRAVVIELKERLTKLFGSLGYANIIQRLKVFTFHGFCKFCLKDLVNNLGFDEWIPKFIKIAKGQPGIISNQLGVIKYVFVDEFQDITKERLELLMLIANPQNTYMTVIGDPNQSIYGYERVNEGGSRSPKENYDHFAALYKPVVLRIGINFRSYPKILEAAERILSYNRDKFDFIPLSSKLTVTHNYREIISCAGIDNNWLGKLDALIHEVNPATGKKYRQIAIMFRRNVEIYRAYNLIEDKKNEHNWNIRIRIQGEGEDFTRIREISWILEDYYRPLLEQKIPFDFIKRFKTYQTLLITKFPNWDLYYINFFECLLLEFSIQREDDSTYMDLWEFVKELSKKDDGQLSKIYYNHVRNVLGDDNKTEIVLTTMHKVKGLEFDAVLIPSSFSNLPIVGSELEDLDENDFREMIEEERRLLYVAYTRAKFRLVAYYGERERALIDGSDHQFSEELINDLGISVPAGLNKYFISWGATESGNAVFEKIERELKSGDPISLRRSINNWFLISNNKKSGCLSNPASLEISNKLNGQSVIEGFRITHILRWTHEETVEFDKPKPDLIPPKRQTDFAHHWSDEAKRRGYIYLIEFSGYGKPVN